MIFYMTLGVVWVTFLAFLWWSISKFQYHFWLLDLKEYADSQMTDFKEINLVLSYKREKLSETTQQFTKTLMESFGASKAKIVTVNHSYDGNAGCYLFTGTISGTFSNKEKFILFAKHAKSHGIGVI